MAAIVNITYQLGPAVSGWLLVKCLFLGSTCRRGSEAEGRDRWLVYVV